MALHQIKGPTEYYSLLAPCLAVPGRSTPRHGEPRRSTPLLAVPDLSPPLHTAPRKESSMNFVCGEGAKILAVPGHTSSVPSWPIPASPLLASLSRSTPHQAVPRHAMNYQSNLTCWRESDCPRHAAPSLYRSRQTSPLFAMPSPSRTCPTVPHLALNCLFLYFKPTKFRAPITQTNVTPSIYQKVRNFRRIQKAIFKVDGKRTCPITENRACSHNGISLHAHADSKPKIFKLKQFMRITGTIINQWIQSFDVQSSFNLLSLLLLASSLRQRSFNAIARQCRSTIGQIQPGVPFQPCHFFKVGVGFVSLGRYGLQGFRKAVQRICCLAVVQNQRADAVNRVALGFPHRRSLCWEC
jgi:hypothetical protein